MIEYQVMSTESPITDALPGDAYAWGGTYNRVTEKYLLQSIKAVEGNVDVVDLCSALPISFQITRERHRERCLNQAVNILGHLAKIIQHKAPHQLPSNHQIPTLINLNPESKRDNIIRREIKNQISPKKSIFRQLLTAAEFNIFHSPSTAQDQSPESTHSQLASNIQTLLQTSTTIPQKRWELEPMVGQGRWEIIEPHDTDTTFEQQLENIIPSAKMRQNLVQEISQVLATLSLPHFRQFNTYTLDIENPEIILTKALTSFPDHFINTEFFGKAKTLLNHIQADTLKLPFPKNSVAFFSSCEGWPFFFKGIEQEKQLQFAVQLYDTLKPGGQAVLFPWMILNGEASDETFLSEIISLWKSMGANTTIETHSTKDLLGQMSDREHMLTYKSPLFQSNGDTISACILEKPINTTSS